jgi:hypothetical protein
MFQNILNSEMVGNSDNVVITVKFAALMPSRFYLPWGCRPCTRVRGKLINNKSAVGCFAAHHFG